MTCPLQTKETVDLLIDYSARRLDAAKTASLERHLETCEECAAFHVEQAAVWEALDAWEPLPVSADFNRRLWQRIDAVAAEPWYKSLATSMRFANWKPVLPLAAAVVVIAMGFVLDHPGDRVFSPGISGHSVTEQSMSVKEADQVEQTLDDIQLLHQFDAIALPDTPKAM
jgi:anti-sigma factor RsiW